MTSTATRELAAAHANAEAAVSGTPCESCDAVGLDVEATTRSTNPDWSGYALCAECAAEFDARDELDPLPICRLTGVDGNAFAVIGAVSKALKDAGLRERAADWTAEAFTQPTYDALLHLAFDYVDVR